MTSETSNIALRKIISLYTVSPCLRFVCEPKNDATTCIFFCRDSSWDEVSRVIIGITAFF